MGYLLLAILSSAAVSLFMRLGETHIKNTMAMFMANYFACSLVARLFMLGRPFYSGAEGMPFALSLGLVSGVLFLVSFLLLKYNISKNGVVLSSIFMKLGVLVPTVMAVAAFHERPTALQIAGFALAILAIIVINLEPGEKRERTARGGLWLILLLLVGGMADSFCNIYDKMGVPAFKDDFLFFTFFTAFLICLVVVLVQRKKICGADILFGLLIGVPNYFSSRFLLLALGRIPAVVSYPVYNISTIVIISLVGVFFFREKLDRRKLLGMGLICLALVMLNI